MSTYFRASGLTRIAGEVTRGSPPVKSPSEAPENLVLRYTWLRRTGEFTAKFTAAPNRRPTVPRCGECRLYLVL